MKGPEAKAIHEARKAQRERAAKEPEPADNSKSARVKGVSATAVSAGEKL